MTGEPRPASAGLQPAGAAEPPSATLGDVWEALDVLPRATGSIDLAATTVEMVAVSVAPPRRPSPVRWLVPAAAVVACLAAGVVAGRATVADPRTRRGDELPLIAHLDLLREAGTVSFLEQVVQRGYRPPQRPGPLRTPEARRADAGKFLLEIEQLERALERTADPRANVAALSAERQVELAKAQTAFARLSSAERRLLAGTARALVARPELRQAALEWHQWLATARPEDRDAIIARTSEGRLEWLDYYAARFEIGAGDRPPREWERRGPPRPPGPPARGPEGRPRWPPVRPGDPPPGPPPETAAPPR